MKAAHYLLIWLSSTLGAGVGFAASPVGLPAALTLASNAIQPHMAVSDDGIYVTFIHDGNISVTVSRDNGKTFSPPVVAIDAMGKARGGAHRGPRIGVDAQDHLIITAPVTFDESEYKKKYPTTDLFFVRSSDGGKTWTKPIQINEVSKKSPEALHWMAMAPSGEAHVAWLDMRDRESGQDIYYATIADGRVAKNVKVANTVCECCAPGLTVDATGQPFLSFREGGDKPSREIFALHPTANRGVTELFQVNRTKTREHG